MTKMVNLIKQGWDCLSLNIQDRRFFQNRGDSDDFEAFYRRFICVIRIKMSPSIQNFKFIAKKRQAALSARATTTYVVLKLFYCPKLFKVASQKMFISLLGSKMTPKIKINLSVFSEHERGVAYHTPFQKVKISTNQSFCTHSQLLCQIS